MYNKLEMDHRLKCKAKTIKLLEKNIGKKILWCWGRKRFLSKTLKAWTIKNNRINWTSSKLKDTIKKIKREAKEQEKIQHKELASRIYKDILCFKNQHN